MWIILVFAAMSLSGAITSQALNHSPNQQLLSQAAQVRKQLPALFANAKGIVILQVSEGEQGQRLGLQRGDIIVGYASQPVNDVDGFVNMVQRNQSNPSIGLQVVRGGQLQTLKVQGGKLGIILADIIPGELLAEAFFAEWRQAFNAQDGEAQKRLVSQNPHMAQIVRGRLKKLAASGIEVAPFHRVLAWALDRRLSPPIGALDADMKTLYTLFQRLMDQAAARQMGKADGKADRAINTGLSYQELGQYQLALEQFQQALSVAQKLDQRLDQLQLLISIGAMYDYLAAYDQAIAAYDQAIALARQLNHARGLAYGLANKALVHQLIGDYDKAQATFEQALTELRKNPEFAAEAETLNNIGVLHRDRGEFSPAVKRIKEALAVAEKRNDPLAQARSLSNLGLVHADLGQNQQALNFFQRSLKLALEGNLRETIANNYNNQGFLYMSMQRFRDAQAAFERALKIHRRVANKREEARILANLGTVLGHLDDRTQAEARFNEALVINRQIQDRRGEGDNLVFLGQFYLRTGRPDKARAAFQNSLPILEELHATDTQWQAQRGLAAAEAELGHLDVAAAHYLNAADTIESLRGELSEKSQRLSFFENKLQVYDELIQLLQRQYQLSTNNAYAQNAFQIFERKQGRVFLEQIGQSGARRFAGLSTDITKRERELATRLAKLDALLQLERGKEDTQQDLNRVANLEQQIKHIEQQQQTLQDDIRDQFPAYHALKYPRPIDPANLQAMLTADDLMLVYNVMPESAALWMISRDRLDMYQLSTAASALAERVTALNRAIKRKPAQMEMARGRVPILTPEDEQSWPTLAHALYTQLIPQAVQKRLPGKHLFIIPSGPLYQLPFEALVTNSEGEDARYLIETSSVSYLSSASLLRVIREAEQSRDQSTARAPLLAFASPVYSDDKTRTQDTDEPTLTKRLAVAFRASTLRPLPETEAEARAIAMGSSPSFGPGLSLSTIG